MKNILLFVLFLFASFAQAQTAGPNNPDTVATSPTSACLGCFGEIWNNEMNAQVLDNMVTDVSLQPNGSCFQSTCFYSRYLHASDFGFNIPGTATVNGVTVEIYRNPLNANMIADSAVQLSVGGIPSGQNKAIPGTWPVTPAYYVYGSATDLWGLALTPADVNSNLFGVFLKVFNTSGSFGVPAHVDHIRITVDYSTTTGIQLTQSSSPGFFNAMQNGNEVQVSFSLDRKSSVQVNVWNAVGDLATSLPGG